MRQNYSDPAEVVASVERELQGSGSLISYRLTHQGLRTDRHLELSLTMGCSGQWRV